MGSLHTKGVVFSRWNFIKVRGNYACGIYKRAGNWKPIRYIRECHSWGFWLESVLSLFGTTVHGMRKGKTLSMRGDSSRYPSSLVVAG